MSRTLLTALLLTAALSTVPSAAQARSLIRQPFGGHRPFQLDFHGGFSYVGRGLAVGARFGIPIVHNGFVKKINNAIYINFGADFYFVDYKGGKKGGYGPAVGIPVTMHWEFYFTPKWTAFGEIGPNLYLHPSLFGGDGWKWSGAHWISACVGGRYFVTRSLALTLRLGNPYASFGVSLML